MDLIATQLAFAPDSLTLPRIEAERPGVPLLDAPPELRRLATTALAEVGGVLIRGFRLGDPNDLRRFAESFGHGLMPYDYGSTPRSAVGEHVYTSTEYPASQSIPLHNEQSYTRQWPMKLWFHCVAPAPAGGRTPIADSRAVLRRISPTVRDTFEARGLVYVRNYGNGLDLPWRKVFGSEDPAVVQRFCEANGLDCEWKPDGELRTREIGQVVERHPVTGEAVWFNQAHLFHVSGLPDAAREALLEIVEPADLPRNVYHADGAPIDTRMLDEIRAAYDDCAIHFEWRAGDVLMLDNMLMAHGRTPFRGDRKVLVAMAQPHSSRA